MPSRPISAGRSIRLALPATSANLGPAFDAAALVEPSAPAGLLPPITIEGRKGWDCTAERNAMATTLSNAALPAGN